MRLHAGLVCFLLLGLVSNSGLAQQPAKGDPVPLGLGSSAGIRAFREGRWGVVGVEIANPRNEPVEVQATFYFSKAPEVQFGRRMWIPARSRRVAHCPLVPSGMKFDKSFEIRNKLYEVLPDGKLKLLPDLGGEMQRSMLLSKTPERIISAIFPSMPYESVPETALPTAYDALLAMRISAGLTRRVGEVARPNYPDQLHYFDTVDQMLINNESPFSDAATTATIRQWVQRGGRLWIMLDQVPFEKVAAMLGDAFRCSLVGEVELNDFSITPSDPQVGNAEVKSFERPVKMVRVDTDNVDVRYTADGWPAAFVQNFGLGRVLFTTISPPAWVRRERAQDNLPQDPERRADWVADPPLLDLAGLMMDTHEQDTPRDQGLNTYVAEKVGYKIVSRTPVFAILLSYVVALGGFGAVLLKRHRAGNLVWIAPLLIVLAATPIALMAAVAKRNVPRTNASIQVIQISPSAKEAHVDGSMALFLQVPEVIAVSGEGSEAFMTSSWGSEGSIRELLWTDYDKWTWNNLHLTGGMKMAALNKPVRLKTPMRALVSFDVEGVQGHVEGAWAPVEDAQIHVSSRRGLALQMEGEQFSAGENDLLAKDQYIAGNLLDDEQRRRQTLIRALVREQPERLYSTEPTLLFWTKPLDLKVTVPKEAQETGAALVRLPIQIQRPAENTSFLIPSTFLPFKVVSGPTGKGAASTYHQGRAEWVPMTTSSETWLRVQFPTAVLPARIDRLKINLDIDAPLRTVELAMEKEGKAVVQFARENPSGPLEFEITKSDLLHLDDNGGLVLGIIVGEPKDDSNHNPEWRVQDLQLTAHASR